MQYLRVEEGNIKILPPSDVNAGEYLRQVRRELAAIFAKGKPVAMYRIDLENGQRGGSFTNSTTAVIELLTELVDESHSTTSKKTLTAN